MSSDSPRHDAVHFFMSELTSQIVAETGIPSDRFHLGKIILKSLRDAPDFTQQIDGSTGRSEDNRSVLERSVRCAIALKNMGLQKGDIITLMAPNHLDLVIPLYAAIYLGIIVAPLDRNLEAKELQEKFNINKPKLIFCQNEKVEDIRRALEDLDFECQIVTFDDSSSTLAFSKLMSFDMDSTDISEFKPLNFDPNDTILCLAPTSGTSNFPKSVVISHKNFTQTTPYFWMKFQTFPCLRQTAFITASLNWITTFIMFVHSPIFRFTRLQSPLPMTSNHARKLIKNYQPTFAIFSPTMLYHLTKIDTDDCDFGCFDFIFVGGADVSRKIILHMKNISPRTEILQTYGLTEISSVALYGSYPLGSCGGPLGSLQYRLIDITTQQDINEPNLTGELWLKGPGVFKEYYNNPEETKNALTDDGWLKTGDLFYRDENWNFFFMDRIKSLFKYKNNQISPLEIEAIIREHPGVFDVVVTGVPDLYGIHLPMAFVVLREGHNVSAKTIENLVADSLPDPKRLRGGVVFLDALPMTATTKIDRRKLKEMAISLTMNKL